MDEISEYGRGWAFFKGGSQADHLLPPAVNCIEWVKGYAAALADYDPKGETPSIEVSLRQQGLAGELLEACLQAADKILAEDEWCRWPLVPVRHSLEALDERDKRILRDKGLYDEMG